MIYNKKLVRNDLYEALDGKGHPLCLLPFAEILRQGLFHKSVALLLVDRKGRMLFQTGADNLYDFSFFGPVPAPFGKDEFAGQVAFGHWKTENPQRLCEYRPCPENRYSFSVIFSLPVSTSLAEMFASDSKNTLLADSVEMASLIEYGLDVSPFLKLFLERAAN